MKHFEYENRNYYFISTAHVSKASVEEVREAIESLQPQAVAIELDAGRAYQLRHNNSKQDLDIKQIIKGKQVSSFLMNLVLSSYQKKLADDLNTQVGQEMVQAMTCADAVGATLYTIDRDIKVTMKRIWRTLSFRKKLNLAATLITSTLSKEDIEAEEVEALKEQDLLHDAVKELDAQLPDVSYRLLHERNYYMAEKLKLIEAETIVVVVGAAHTEGILEAMHTSHTLAELETVPDKKKNGWLGWIIPGVLVLGLLFLTLRSPQVGLQQLLVWMGLSSTLALIGALVSGSHLLTALAAFLTTPIGIVSPVLAVGFFAAITEAYVRPPKMHDFETISDDVSTLKGWYSNKVLRIVLIMIVTNLMSFVGTLIAGSRIFQQLFF